MSSDVELCSSMRNALWSEMFQKCPLVGSRSQLHKVKTARIEVHGVCIGRSEKVRVTEVTFAENVVFSEAATSRKFPTGRFA
jgi:hypothetical protein